MILRVQRRKLGSSRNNLERPTKTKKSSRPPAPPRTPQLRPAPPPEKQLSACPTSDLTQVPYLTELAIRSDPVPLLLLRIRPVCSLDSCDSPASSQLPKDVIRSACS